MKNILIILCLVLFQGCNTDDNMAFTPSLPAISQTGANTFGCYINGRLLTPRNGTGTFNSPDYGMKFYGFGTAPNYNYNEISVHDFKSERTGSMRIHITDLKKNGEGEFRIDQSNCEVSFEANPTINLRCRVWDEKLEIYKRYCSMENSGKLIISRYDSENGIVSGTFSCKARNEEDPSDIVEITQGRFDIKWSILDDADFP